MSENEKPKRPMSAYLLWLNSARAQIKSENPGLRVTEVAKKGGEMWRSMEDKSEWEEKAAKAKEQYTKELESYVAKGGTGAPAKQAKSQKRGKKGRAAPANKKAKQPELDDEGEEEGDEGEEEASE